MHTPLQCHTPLQQKVRQRLHGGWQRFKGQKQKWFLVHFYGTDDEINLVTAEQEFGAYKWWEIGGCHGIRS